MHVSNKTTLFSTPEYFTDYQGQPQAAQAPAVR